MILSSKSIPGINLESFLESKITSGHTNEILIIVPTNRKLRDLKKKIIDSFKIEPLTKIYIETLTTLSTKLLKETKYFIPLSEAAASVLIKETTDHLDLRYFNKYSRGIPFGTLDRIINVISEYKRHGITPESILNEGSSLSGSEKEKAGDLSKIYKLYSSKCSELKAYELGDIYSSLLETSFEVVKESFSTIYPGCKEIIFDGFDEFTNLEINILNLLSGIVKKKLIISFDYHYGNPNLFSHLDNTFSNLINNGFIKIKDQTPEGATRFKEIISKGLFNEIKASPKNDFKDKVYKLNASNRIDEVEQIAKIIKLKIERDSVPPEKICVTFNIISNYSNFVRDIFGKFEIPFNLTDRIPLKSAQPVIAAVSLIDLLENDFYYHDLLRVVTSKFFSFPNIDLNNIVFTANKLKITRGLKNWENSVNDAVNILLYQNELSENEKNHLVKSYQQALKDIEKISKLLSPLKKKNTKKQFLTYFRKILLELKLPNNILNESFGREEEFTKSVTVFLQTLEEVLQLIDPGMIDKKYPLVFYIDQIRTISNWSRFNVKEKSDLGVLVTSINEIRGLKFDYLFLGGMCDGDFPTKYSPEIFSTGSFQKKDLVHQTEERYHLYQTLCCWKKQLYLSMPKSDGKSELVESTFLHDLEKVIGMKAQTPELNNKIFCREELQIEFANNLDNNELAEEFQNKIISKDYISKLIDTRKERVTDPFSKNIYSGFIGKKSSILKFLRSFAEKQFSVSQLETYAKCPYKYFSDRVLNIKAIEEPTEEIEPIELGIILHSILFEFYSKILREKIPIEQEGTKEFEYIKNALFNIARSKLSELKLNSPIAFFEKEKILGIEGNEKYSILYKFLQTEVERISIEDFSPLLLEKEFGKFNEPDKLTDPKNFSIGEINIRGKIDRIDLNLQDKVFDVIDYKLKGRKPTINDLKEGISLQLPLYLLAAQNLLSNMKKSEFKAFRMIIYSLDFNKDNFGPVVVSLSRKRSLNLEQILELNEEQIKLTKLYILKYHSKIKEGIFNLSELDNREDKICRYCDYKSLCRVKEVFGV